MQKDQGSEIKLQLEEKKAFQKEKEALKLDSKEPFIDIMSSKVGYVISSLLPYEDLWNLQKSCRSLRNIFQYNRKSAALILKNYHFYTQERIFEMGVQAGQFATLSIFT